MSFNIIVNDIKISASALAKTMPYVFVSADV